MKTTTTTSPTTDTLHSLLLCPPSTDLNKKQQQQQPHKAVVSSSDVSDIAAEALRITRQESTSSSGRTGSLTELRPNGALPKLVSPRQSSTGSGSRLNKFVKRLHDMLQAEKDGGVIEWRKGLLVLHSTADFAKNILPKFFNTRNFKTFRRQLNYYGFVHVRSFSTAAASTTALWVNQELAELGSPDIASVLTLKRVEPCELQKTAEGRRQRKEMAMHTVEEDLKIDPKTMQLEQIHSLGRKGAAAPTTTTTSTMASPMMTDHTLIPSIPMEIAFANSRLSSPLQQHHHDHATTTENTVVSDDTQSASSSVVPAHHHHNDVVDDSMGAANLLLMLSRAGC